MNPPKDVPNHGSQHETKTKWNHISVGQYWNGLFLMQLSCLAANGNTDKEIIMHSAYGVRIFDVVRIWRADFCVCEVAEIVRPLCMRMTTICKPHSVKNGHLKTGNRRKHVGEAADFRWVRYQPAGTTATSATTEGLKVHDEVSILM
jgi:hypothetical protein